MTPVVLSVHQAKAQYGHREVFRGVSFDVRASHSLGVLGANGAGKTTLLRMIVGCITPVIGEVRIAGLPPRDALSKTGVAYFAGAATLPPSARASAWGSLGNGDRVTADRRPIRVLSHGSRQLLGLRTVLSRQPLQLAVLDEPWEGLDTEGARWLSTTLEAKRDRGAALVISSHRLHDLAGLCDAYLFLMPHQAILLKAQEIARVGPVTAALLADVFDRVRDRTSLIVRDLASDTAGSPPTAAPP
jgi:ABC-2 type transport system ATP-binding protein